MRTTKSFLYSKENINETITLKINRNIVITGIILKCKCYECSHFVRAGKGSTILNQLYLP